MPTKTHYRSVIEFRTGGPPWNVVDGVLAVGLTAIDDDGTRHEDNLHFSVPNGFVAHGDCLGAALSTLCGRKYERIAFDFAVSNRCKEMIESCYGIEVVHAGAPVEPRPPGRNIGLNFSGGFDSLAALLLAGDRVKLVSLDFGGYFAREEQYFATFPTTICRTDFRRKHYDRNDWRFMACGALLLADVLDLGIVALGTIFEASLWNYRKSTVGRAPVPDGPFGAAGLVESPWTRGLTELGTAMVIAADAPERIPASLRSLASRGSEKVYRKQLLAEMALERLGITGIELGERIVPEKKTEFGVAYTIDFLAPLFVQRYGREFVSRWISGIPDDADAQAVIESDLGFYSKYNPNFIETIPPEIRLHVLARMHSAGLFPFNERDFITYDRVRSFLGRYYAFPD